MVQILICALIFGGHEGEKMASFEQIDPVLRRVAQVLAKSQSSSDWQNFVEPAQSVLRALREPSAEMLEAAAFGMPDWGGLPKGWRAMIDHVIGEEPQQLNDNSAALKSVKLSG